jgi:adenylate kinase family enzyme
MTVIVFLLGRPGSGKSQIARYIKGDESPATSDREGYLPENCEVVHITDYKHLLQMFQQEKEQKPAPTRRCFKSSKYGGFSVTKFGFSHGVLDDALEQVNANILREMENEHEGTPKLILIEFARSDYRSIKNAFDTNILENAWTLYLQVDHEICVERVQQRARHRQWEDDSFVPSNIMNDYYGKEDLMGVEEVFRKEKIEVIENSGDWSNTQTRVEEFIRKCFYTASNCGTLSSKASQSSIYEDKKD